MWVCANLRKFGNLVCFFKQYYIVVKIVNFFKGGCTRFEVEHISCNLLLYIGKNSKNIFVENFTALKVYPKIAAYIRAFPPMFGR